MNGFIAKPRRSSAIGRLTLVLSFLAAALTPTLASALPSAGNSTIPCGIILVGTKNGVADPAGEFTISVRDGSNNAVGGSSIVISFDNCTDVRICNNQPAGGSASCSGGSVEYSGTTDGSGNLTVSIVGGGRGSTVSQSGACATVFADGINLGTMSVAAVDLDGANGVGSSDLSLWYSDYFSGNHYARADYDCSSSVGPSDLSLWYDVYFDGNSKTSCTSYCN
jgi:hypothetical protein